MLKKAQTKNSGKAGLNDIHSSQKPISKPQSQSNTAKFDKFDIVWAKITGYPWWPAIVTTVPGEKDNSHKEENARNRHTQLKVSYNSKADYRVDFIADQTHAFLKKNFLLKYIQNRERLYAEGLQFSSRKRRYFQMAINEADQLQQVLQISKAEVNQFHLEEKKDQKCQKYSKIIPDEDNDEESLSILNQQVEKSSKIQNSQVQSKSKKPDVNLLQRRKLELNLPIQITNQNKKNEQSLQKDIERKQDNKMQATQITQKRRNRSTKIVQSQSNSLFINESRKNTDIANKDQMQQVIKFTHQQNFPQVQIQMCDEKERSNEIKQQKQTKNREKECQNKKQLSIKDDQIFMLFQNSNVLMNDLLIKYKLDTIDEVEDIFKNQINAKNRVQAVSLQNTSSIALKGSKSGMLKSFLLNINKKKNANGRKYNGDKYSESNIFVQNITVINKLKESEHEKVSFQQKQNLFQYAKKYTSRKIYFIVLNILKKNKIYLTSQQTQSSIKEKCRNISDLIFNEEEIQKVTNQNKINPNSSKKRINKLENGNFFTSFKRKLQQSVKFLRLFTLQNWELLTKVATFSTELCIQIKSFEQFLQKQCHLIMRNEQKFEDIVKQIGIQSQKTAFIYGPLINQMQVQNDSVNASPNKYLNQQNGCHHNLIHQGEQVIELK